MTFQPRPPLFVFGRADDVFVADTVATAVQHVNAHLDGDDDPTDFEVFDFDGTPLALADDDTLVALQPWQYLQERMRGVARRLQDDEELVETGGDTLAVLKGFVEAGPTQFAALAADLANRIAAGPFGPIPDPEGSDTAILRVGHPHSGSFSHNLCHRMHLCD